jgi:hypothetical protein
MGCVDEIGELTMKHSGSCKNRQILESECAPDSDKSIHQIFEIAEF